MFIVCFKSFSVLSRLYCKWGCFLIISPSLNKDYKNKGLITSAETEFMRWGSHSMVKLFSFACCNLQTVNKLRGQRGSQAVLIPLREKQKRNSSLAHPAQGKSADDTNESELLTSAFSRQHQLLKFCCFLSKQNAWSSHFTLRWHLTLTPPWGTWACFALWCGTTTAQLEIHWIMTSALKMHLKYPRYFRREAGYSCPSHQPKTCSFWRHGFLHWLYLNSALSHVIHSSIWIIQLFL